MAFIENFDRIYGERLYTYNTLYKVERDTMTIAPHHHTLRLIPEVGKSSEPKTIVLMKTIEGIKIGMYIDRDWNPVFIKDTRFRDIKRFEDFKILLATLIEPYE
jgi:hypothetical protein